MKRNLKKKVVVVICNCRIKTVNDRNPEDRDITKGLRWLRKMS